MKWKLFAAWVIGIVAALVVFLLLPYTGLLDMSATVTPGPLDWWGHTAWERSVSARAPEGENPVAGQPDAIREGYEHYEGSCVLCHGAPNVPRAEFARGMTPQPPRLTAEHVAERTPGELFHIVKHGARMTGMPAFGGDHSDEQIWEIVAFLQQIDHLDPGQVRALKERTAEHHEHGHEGGHEGAHGH